MPISQEAKQAIRERLDEITKEISNLQRDVDTLKDERDKLVIKFTATKDRLDSLKSEKQKLADDIQNN
jgi:predicted nuclease with TOPRIM domain